MGERRHGLDLLRSVAAQAVVVGHACNLWLPAFFMHRSPSGFSAKSDFLYVQNVAVAAFFALSGFLIASALQRSDNLSAFLHDRAKRIFRPLVAAVLLIWALELIAYGDGFRSDYQVYDLSSLSAVLSATLLVGHPAIVAAGFTNGVMGDAQQLWTVALEWWIYVAAGAFVLGRSKTAAILATLAALMPAWHVYRGDALPLAWLAGATVYNARSAVRRWHGYAALLSGTAFAACNGWDVYAAAPCILISCGLLIISMHCGGHRIATGTAPWSYALYLTHLPVLFACHRVYDTPVAAIAAIAMANAVAYVFWRCLDVKRLLPWLRGHLRRPPAQMAS